MVCTVPKLIRLFCLVLTLVLLQGCSVFYTPGMSTLRELCEKDGGMPVYEEIKVKGYFEKRMTSCGCWSQLTYWGYDFMEVEITEPLATDPLPERGFWRISKVKRESGECDARFESKLDEFRGSSGYDEFLERFCIKAEKIEQPNSRYHADARTESWRVSDFYGSRIARLETTVYDNEKGALALKKVNYVLTPYPNSALDYGKTYSCLDTHGKGIFKIVIQPLE